MKQRNVADSPFTQKLQSHEGEDEDAEHEEQEDVEDLRQSVPDASERPAELAHEQTHNTHTNTHTPTELMSRLSEICV